MKGLVLKVALALVGLLLVVTQVAPRERSGASSFGQRLLGPIATLAAAAEWVRFDLALREGRPEEAYARAHRALALDPGAPEGWITLAQHLILQRGTVLREPDAEARRAWIEAGFEALAEGEARSREPDVVAFETGLMWLHVTGHAESLGYDEARARVTAIESFERAGRLGHPGGAEAAREVAARQDGG